jgi:hypothetical protein
MESRIQNALYAAVIKLLRPLIRIFLRNGLPYGAFTELARWVYVDVAQKEFGIAGRKQTDSRVSILTGLSRKEVRRLRLLDPPTDAGAVARYNRAARVIAGWRRDPQFCDLDGQPNPLALENGTISFTSLVRTYSGDVPPRAILDELMAIKAVEMLGDGRIQLLAKAYVPAGDASVMHNILGHDVAQLIATIDHNTQIGITRPWLQRKVAYDNVPEEAVENIRRISARAGQDLLEHLDRSISQFDRDVNPKVLGGGRKYVGVGIYYFENDAENTARPLDEDDHNNE